MVDAVPFTALDQALAGNTTESMFVIAAGEMALKEGAIFFNAPKPPTWPSNVNSEISPSVVSISNTNV